MKAKKLKRLRRALKTRRHIRELGVPRLSVHRTSQHIYAQILTEAASGSVVITCASSVEKDMKKGNKQATAKHIGTVVAQRAKEQGIDRVAFDRSGFKYHGRIKALADAAREAGLKF